MCACFRPVDGISVCETCIHIRPYINDIENGKLPANIQELRKPIVCPSCNFRFADRILLAAHNCKSRSTGVQVNPRELTVPELKKMLTEKGERSSGSKETLCQRLENILSY